MVRTRQSARLEAARQAKVVQSQEKVVQEEHVSSDEVEGGSSSDEDSGGEMADSVSLSPAGELLDKKMMDTGEGQTQKIVDRSDAERDCLPDVLSLESCEEPVRAASIYIRPREWKAKDGCEVSSSLDPGPDMMGQLYLNFDLESVVEGHGKRRPQPLGPGGCDPLRELMKKSVITTDFEKREAAPPITQSRYAAQKMKKAERERSTGRGWFDMPAPQLTEELKNDLKLLRMRNALDPARHYKKADSKNLPRYFQVGRVERCAADFYSGQLPRSERKQTLVDELLASEASRRYHKKKYLELQSKFTSGTKRLRNIKHRKKYKK